MHLYTVRRRGFSLIEMLTVLLVISILAGIALAVGTEVTQSSQRSLTGVELKNLQSALDTYRHKTGLIPPTMSSFLTAYQALYAYQDSSNLWHERANVLTNLPANMVVSGTITMPLGGTMSAITQVNDAYGDAIEYIPYASINPHTPFFVSFGPSRVVGAGNIYSYDP